MRKKVFTSIFVLVSLCLGAQELPRVAVMDGIVDNNVVFNASPVVANYISESFTASGKYTVVNRGSIYTSWQGSPLPDINMGSLMNRGDYKALGNLLNVDYICIPRVEKKGRSYKVTAELIQVANGSVVARESAVADNRIENLIDASRLTGAKLTGGSLSTVPLAPAAPLTVAVVPQASESSSATPSETTNEAVKQSSSSETMSSAPNKKSSSGSPTAFSSMTFSLLLPSFTGNEDTYTLDGYIYNKPIYDLYSSYSPLDIGLDFNVRFTGSSFFCFDFGITYATQVITYDYYDSYYGTYEEETYMNFALLDFYIGPGVVFPLTDNFQLVGGATIGFGAFFLGSEMWDNSTEGAFGVTWGIHAGADFKTMGDFVLTLRYKYSWSAEYEGTDFFTASDISSGYDTSFGYHGIMIGIGSAL